MSKLILFQGRVKGYGKIVYKVDNNYFRYYKSIINNLHKVL